MFVIGTEGGFGSSKLVEFVSTDLVNWESFTVFEDRRFTMYNTSFCKGDGEYVLALEIGTPKEIVGESYTIIFAKSFVLRNWAFLDYEKYVFKKERYTACPAIRYEGGYYYMVYLELMTGYNCVPYIVRTKDFLSWELAPLNPIMFYGEEDRRIPNQAYFTEEEQEDTRKALDTNNSDVDFCEYKGKTVLTYSWGNQLGHEFLAWAEYSGPMREFFESFFD